MGKGAIGSVTLLLAVVVGAYAAPARVAESRQPPAPPLRVSGNQLVDPTGTPIQLRGVNEGVMLGCYLDNTVRGFIDEPHRRSTIDALKSWRINAVRLALTEDCWLGINRGRDSVGVGAPYRRKLVRWVRLLGENGIYAILDLHAVAPGRHRSVPLSGEPYIWPAPDRSHARDFWESIAGRFRAANNVLFDIYNEPWGIGWRCWRDGCRLERRRLVREGGELARDVPLYRTAGSQSLVNAIRSTGAEQPILVAGIHYANLLDRWLRFRPHDPLDQIVASFHPYRWGCQSGRPAECWPGAARVARRVPVVAGEFGEPHCGHRFNQRVMRWSDRSGFGYLAWIWASRGWSGAGCRTLSLIRNSDGAPTRYGAPIRDHYRGNRHGRR